jgi:peptidyl-prolyl cis-trans isomerase SurA
LRPAAALVFAALSALAAAAPAEAGGKKPLDGIAALVNDEVILYSEVMERARPIFARLESQGAAREHEMNKVMTEVVNAIISERLVRQQLRELHMDVTEQEIDAAINDVKKQKGLDDSRLRAAIEGEGLSFREYREALRQHILRSKLFAVKVRPRVKITDEDVKNWYTQNLNAAAAGVGMQVAAVFIETPKGAGPAEIKEARGRAGRAYARIAAGEDFSKIASELSSGDWGKNGGDMGVVKRGSLSPELDRVVFALREGQVSEPVEGPSGFFIFKAVKAMGGEARELREVKDEIYRRLFDEESERQFRLWLEEVRRASHLEIKLKEGEARQ